MDITRKVVIYCKRWPPATNILYRRSGNHIHLNPKAAEFYRAFRKHMPAMEIIQGPVKVSIWHYPPHTKRYDLDSRVKSLLDALVHGCVIVDDHQVTELCLYKHEYDESRMGVWIEVEELAGS